MEIINKYTTRTFNTAAGSVELVTVQGIDTEIISALYKGLNEVADQPEMKYSGDEIVDAVAAEPLNYETPYQQAYINAVYDKLKAERTSITEPANGNQGLNDLNDLKDLNDLNKSAGAVSD